MLPPSPSCNTLHSCGAQGEWDRSGGAQEGQKVTNPSGTVPPIHPSRSSSAGCQLSHLGARGQIVQIQKCQFKLNVFQKGEIKPSLQRKELGDL